MLLMVFFPVVAWGAPVSREIPLAQTVDLAFPKDYNFQFSLWDTGVLSNPIAKPIWWERKRIRLTGKTLKHALGSVNPVGNPLDPAFFAQQLWLQVDRWNPATSAWVALSPRTKLNIIPYAFFSESVAPGSIAADRLLDGTALEELLDDDGAGSGLDADLLDGRDAADFAASGHAHDAAYVNVGEPGSVSTGTIADGVVTKPKLSAVGGTNGQILSTNGTNLKWVTPQNGDVTGVTAGDGLTRGAAVGEVTLNVGAGTGITVTNDAVAVDTTVVQKRVAGTCTDGSMRAIGSDGGVSCGWETRVWHVERAQNLAIDVGTQTVVRALTVPMRLGTYVVTVSGTIVVPASWYRTSCSITTGTNVESSFAFHAAEEADGMTFPFGATRAFTFACTSYPCYLPLENTFRLVCQSNQYASVALNTSMVVVWYE